MTERRRIRLEPIVKPRSSDWLESGFVLTVAIIALVLAIWVACDRFAAYLDVVRTHAV